MIEIRNGEPMQYIGEAEVTQKGKYYIRYQFRAVYKGEYYNLLWDRYEYEGTIKEISRQKIGGDYGTIRTFEIDFKTWKIYEVINE